MSEKQLSIVILDQYISTYEHHNESWENIPIKGEELLEHENNSEVLIESLKALNQAINSKYNLKNCEVSIIYSLKMVEWISKAIQYLINPLQCTKVQVFRYELLLGPYNSHDSSVTSAFLSQNILPKILLSRPDNLIEKQKTIQKKELEYLERSLAEKKEALKASFATESSFMETKRKSLQEEVDALTLQLSNYKKPSLELYVSYLPAIFKDFWNVVPPIELTNIVGNLTPPTIPSPYYSLSDEAVTLLRKKFDVLDHDSKNEVIKLAIQLKKHYSLKTHRFFSIYFDETHA